MYRVKFFSRMQKNTGLKEYFPTSAKQTDLDDDEEEERQRRETQARFFSGNYVGEKANGNEFHTDDGFHDNYVIKQSLQIINIWEKSYSNPRLQFDITNTIVSRNDHFEINPVVITRCFSYSCCITFVVKYGRKVNSEFSFGIVDMEKYAFDFNLSDAIGKMQYSWGISEEMTSSAKFRSQGKPIKKIPLLKNNDKVGIYLDLNSNGRYDGKCYFFINDRLIIMIDDLTCDVNYGIAAILPPHYALEILSGVNIDVEKLVTVDMEEKVESENDQTKESSNCLPRHDEMSSSIPISRPIAMQEDASKPTPAPAFFPSSKNILAPPPTNLISTTISSVAGSSGLDCCICLSANKSVLFLPCKHICVCEDCGLTRSPPLTNCPVCRETIRSKTKVFL